MIPYHLLDLAKLSIGEKLSSADSTIAEQVLHIHELVRLKLEKSNSKYMTPANKKRREKIFEEGDMVIMYLRRENFG